MDAHKERNEFFLHMLFDYIFFEFFLITKKKTLQL